MTTKNVNIYEEQTGITTQSDDFLVDATAQISIVALETAGGAASIQTTIDPHAVIENDTATWVTSPGGVRSDTFMESSTGPITGVRLTADSGTWTLKVLHVKETSKEA